MAPCNRGDRVDETTAASGATLILDHNGFAHNLPLVKARRPKLETEAPEDDAGTPGLAASFDDGKKEDIDLSLLEDSLAKTPWERMLANDDALRFADTLRAGMKKRNAKSERIDSETH